MRSYGASPAASAAVDPWRIQAASDPRELGTLFFDGIFDIGTTGSPFFAMLTLDLSSAILYSGTGAAITLGGGSL